MQSHGCRVRHHTRHNYSACGQQQCAIIAVDVDAVEFAHMPGRNIVFCLCARLLMMRTSGLFRQINHPHMRGNKTDVA